MFFWDLVSSIKDVVRKTIILRVNPMTHHNVITALFAMVTIMLSLITFSQIASSSIPYDDKLSDTRMNYNPIILQSGARISSTTAAEDTCQRLPISNVIANGDDGNHHPPNAIDNNVNTHWSNLGVGSWIQIDLGAQKTICSVDIAWYIGNVRQNNFAISLANDGNTFTNVLSGASSGTTSSPESYTLATNTVSRFIRITVNGNTLNNRASITEIAVNGLAGTTRLITNGIIHGAMTDMTGYENANADLVNAFNNLAGKKIGVAYFSNNWFHGIHFPLEKCNSIRTTGAVPFIRIQNWIREGDKLSDAGPYTHKNIVSGMFDDQLRTYAQAAKSFGTTLLIEYGVEVNGNWFPWSQEGPGAYKAAYRHIVDLFREEGATNVRWAFHIDATDNNNGYKWYPGDDIIEWVGTTCYGDDDHKGCAGSLQDFYNRFAAISKTAKLGIFEWGYGNSTDTTRTLAEIPIKYPRIKLLQVWNEHVIGDSEEPYDRRINSTPQNLAAYREGIANPVYSSKYNDK
jgi:beta-mannanase